MRQLAILILACLAIATPAADRKIINRGQAENDGTGEGRWSAYGKINDNFLEVFSRTANLGANGLPTTPGLGLLRKSMGVTSVWIDSFGADPTGVTNSAAAIQAAIDYCIANASDLNMISLEATEGATYLVQDELDASSPTATASRMWRIRGNGARIIARHGGTAILDLTGRKFVHLSDIWLRADSLDAYPKVGVLLAETATGQQSGNFYFDNVNISGNFSVAPLYNYGVEENVFIGCEWQNLIGDGAIFSCTNRWNVNSSFQTVNSGSISCTLNTLIRCGVAQWTNTAAYTPIRLVGVQNFNLDGYLKACSEANLVMDSSVFSIQHCDIKIHCENAGGNPTNAVRIVGSADVAHNRIEVQYSNSTGDNISVEAPNIINTAFIFPSSMGFVRTGDAQTLRSGCTIRTSNGVVDFGGTNGVTHVPGLQIFVSNRTNVLNLLPRRGEYVIWDSNIPLFCASPDVQNVVTNSIQRLSRKILLLPEGSTTNTTDVINLITEESAEFQCRDGDIVELSPLRPGDVFTVQHGTGNITFEPGLDVELTGTMTLPLVWRSDLQKWANFGAVPQRGLTATRFVLGPGGSTNTITLVNGKIAVWPQ